MFPTAHGVVSQGGRAKGGGGGGFTPAPYLYHRLVVLEGRSGAATGYIGTREVVLKSEPGGTPHRSGIAFASNQDPSYPAAEAFDGVTAANNGWRYTPGAGEHVGLQSPEPITVVEYDTWGYVFNVGSSYARDAPWSFRLEGSNDGVAWDVLDERWDQVHPAYTSLTHTVEGPREGKRKFWRFVFSENGSGTDNLIFQVIELSHPGSGYATSPINQGERATMFDSVSSGRAEFAFSTASAIYSEPFTPGMHVGLEYFVPRPVDKYRITAPSNSALLDRMPKAWELQASLDGTTWVTVDARSNQVGWSTNEVREFTI